MKQLSMDSQAVDSEANRIARFVIENGRVEGEDSGWWESLANEVDFEARERGYGTQDARRLASAAVQGQVNL